MRRKLSRYSAGVLFVLLFGGCFLNPKVTLHYQPTTPAQPLAVENKPAFFLRDVQDKTEGYIESKGGDFYYKYPMPLAVKESLETEFFRLGIPFAGNEQDADIIVEAEVTNIDWGLTDDSQEPLSSEFSFSLTFLDNHRRVLCKESLTGTAKSKRAMFGGSSTATSRPFNNALSDAMSKIGPLLESEEVKAKVFGHKSSSGAVARSEARQNDSSEAAYHSDVDHPAYRNPENADNYALVVGVDKYENLPEADFAERDARAMREHLLALGYPERNIVMLLGARAGKAGLEKSLESWLPRSVNENSKVFFYFSGHGAPDINKGSAYLMPWDGDAKYVEATGYSVKRLYGKLNSLKARQVIVAMDSCFSGTGGRSVIAQGLRPLVTKVDVGEDSLGKIVVLSATGADEVTGTDDEQGHGLFTYYLLKGIDSKQGKSTIKDLYDYLSPRVQNQARRDNREQTPQLLSGASAGIASFPLGG